MCLNGDKFEHLHVGNNLHQVKASYTDPSGNTIEEKQHVKDLGVTVSNDLTWTKQVEEVDAKARVVWMGFKDFFYTRSICYDNHLECKNTTNF